MRGIVRSTKCERVFGGIPASVMYLGYRGGQYAMRVPYGVVVDDLADSNQPRSLVDLGTIGDVAELLGSTRSRCDQ